MSYSARHHMENFMKFILGLEWITGPVKNPHLEINFGLEKTSKCLQMCATSTLISRDLMYCNRSQSCIS